MTIKDYISKHSITKCKANLLTPDFMDSSKFNIEEATNTHLKISTSNGNFLDIPWEKFKLFLEYLLDENNGGYHSPVEIGAKQTPSDRRNLSLYVDSDTGTMHISYVASILDAIGLVKLIRTRLNSVILT